MSRLPRTGPQSTPLAMASDSAYHLAPKPMIVCTTTIIYLRPSPRFSAEFTSQVSCSLRSPLSHTLTLRKNPSPTPKTKTLSRTISSRIGHFLNTGPTTAIVVTAVTGPKLTKPGSPTYRRSTNLDWLNQSPTRHGATGVAALTRNSSNSVTAHRVSPKSCWTTTLDLCLREYGLRPACALYIGCITQ